MVHFITGAESSCVVHGGCYGGRTIVRSSEAGPQMAATILSSTACDICASACRLQVHIGAGGSASHAQTPALQAPNTTGIGAHQIQTPTASWRAGV